MGIETLKWAYCTIRVGGRIHLIEIKTDLRDTTFKAEMDRILISIENLKRLVVAGIGYNIGHLYGISFGFNSPTKYVKFMGY